MSITYDPRKWTDPVRAKNYESVQSRKTKSPVLVSLKELRYFREHNGSAFGTITRLMSTSDEGDHPESESEKVDK